MEETNTPMFKSVRPDEVLSVQKDPVSGNTAPLGATPAEVRDDIPIMASPNEFMIDAATRRYYGTEFFEGLQDAAKQGFQRIKKGEESFFRDDELEVEEAAEKVTSGGSPQQMQEGGEVEGIEGREIPLPTGGGYGGYGGASTFTGYTFKDYIHPTKPQIQIIFFQGRPLSPIPEGYVPKGMGVVGAGEVEDTAQFDDDDGGNEPPKINTWANTDVSQWNDISGTKIWKSYGDRKGVGVDPIGKVFAGLAAFTLTGGASIFTGPTLVNKMESEAAKKAESILKAAQGKIAAGGLSAEDEAIYNKAIVKAEAEIAFFKDKKPFSWKDLVPKPEPKGIVAAADKDLKKDDDDDDGGPSIFYGGTEETETALIQDESLTDDEFFEEFEKGT
jgi:hypothetical protein